MRGPHSTDNTMLQGLLMMEDGDRVLPFVRCFCGSPSTYMWEDEVGVSQDIPQGEGGEQGDPLMPMLFALGQSLGKRVRLRFPGRYLCGCMPERVADVYAIIQQELFAHARISVHHGKTQVWNRGGVVPQDIDIITAAARVRVPDAVVWRGAAELPQGWAPAVCARVLEKEVRGTTSSLRAHTTRERSPGWLVIAVDVLVHPSKFLAPDGVS